MVTAIADEQRKVYGLQFHPEVDLTVNGIAILKNFLFTVSVHSALVCALSFCLLRHRQVAGCTGDFQLLSREESCIKYIREKVESAKVVVSGD